MTPAASPTPGLIGTPDQVAAAIRIRDNAVRELRNHLDRLRRRVSDRQAAGLPVGSDERAVDVYDRALTESVSAHPEAGWWIEKWKSGYGSLAGDHAVRDALTGEADQWAWTRQPVDHSSNWPHR